MEKKSLCDRFKPFGYYRALSRSGGFASAIALSGIFFILHYIFDNYIFGHLRSLSESYETAIWILAGVIGAAALVYAVLTVVFSKRVRALDTALVALVFADIMVIVQKFMVDKVVQNRTEPLLYVLPLAAAVVITVLRWLRYDPDENMLVDTRSMEADAGAAGYYKLMLSKPSAWVGAALTAVVVVAFIVTENAGWFGFTAVSNDATRKLYEIMIGGAVVAAAFYIASFVHRMVYKNINFFDTIAMNTVVLAVGMLVRLAFAHSAADIAVAAVIIVAAAVLQIVLVKRTVNIGSVLYSAEKIEAAEDKKDVPSAADEGLAARVAELERQNAFLMRNAEKLMSLLEEERAKQPAAPAPAANDGETERRVAFLMRNAERTMSLIEEERSLRNGVQEPAPEPAPQRDAFLLRQTEALISKVEYLMSRTALLEEKLAEACAAPAVPATEPVSANDGYDEEEDKFEGERSEVNWIETEAKDRRAKPRYTFDLKLRLADDNVKRFYSDIKNALLSYGMHCRMSRHKENFNKGRNQIARMAINGKTLKVYLAIDPNSIDPKIYHHKDVSDKKGVADLPTMINVRSGLAVRKIKTLIDKIAEELVIKPKKYEPTDFAEGLTLDGFSTVERKGYGYMVKGSATKEEVDAIPDDFATNAVEYVYAPKKAERFIKTKVTLDDLSAAFEDGATVDIDAIREKGLASAPNSNWLSVSASARLDKKFRVYADEYTVGAAKMICVAGGEAYMLIQPEN